MRLTSGMSEAEIRAELEEEALRTWGAQRLEALQAGMTDAARHIRALLELQAGRAGGGGAAHVGGPTTGGTPGRYDGRGTPHSGAPRTAGGQSWRRRRCARGGPNDWRHSRQV